MESFIVLTALLQLHLRHAHTLKDKRQVLQKMTQKLKNFGFSVTEVAHQDNPQRAALGLSFTGRDTGALEVAERELNKHLLGDFEVVGFYKDYIDFEPQLGQGEISPNLF